MEKEIFIQQAKVSNNYNSDSNVQKVTVRVLSDSQDSYKNYYKKYNNPERSFGMGNVLLEKTGYDLLNTYGINTPKSKFYYENGQAVLEIEEAIGIATYRIDKNDIFEKIVASILDNHLNMWTLSRLFDTQKKFGNIRKVYPVYEAFEAVTKIENTLANRTAYPIKYLMNLTKVSKAINKIPILDINNGNLFFQHGDEILDNFIFNPENGKLAAIDPSPILTTRMERALNKLLGGSLLFNFDINDDGLPKDQDKVNRLIKLVKKSEKEINKLNLLFGIDGTPILRELVFVNLSRVHFGLYNKENAKYFEEMDTSRFLKLANLIYDELS